MKDRLVSAGAFLTGRLKPGDQGGVSMIEALGVRERIVETALPLFVEQGYDGISMREIAEACHLSKAGLYYHFVDKEDLFLAILNDSLNELGEILHQSANQVGGTRQKIQFFARSIFTGIPAGHRGVIRLANQEIKKIGPQKRADFDRSYGEKFIQPLAQILQDGVDRGELKPVPAGLAVWGLLGLMYPFFSTEHARSAQEGEQIVEFIMTVFFEGLQRD
jgi:AcrR family transcriptional regulator